MFGATEKDNEFLGVGRRGTSDRSLGFRGRPGDLLERDFVSREILTHDAGLLNILLYEVSPPLVDGFSLTAFPSFLRFSVVSRENIWSKSLVLTRV